MSRHFADWDEQTLDLAIDRFTVGPDPRGDATLARLALDADLRDFENALTSIQLGSLSRLETPPAEFTRRLERAGREVVAANAGQSAFDVGTPSRRASRVLSLAGWLVAAALLLSFLLLRDRADANAGDLRRSLLADASDLIRIEWTATEDAAAARSEGDVVWSSSRQEGYMRFRGLAPNDPSEQQYQLWIFDPTRVDWEARPVDGGVFDVPSAGEVVVPIEAKLAVRETALFAVTLEVPGGVVVSERERLVLTATP